MSFTIEKVTAYQLHWRGKPFGGVLTSVQEAEEKQARYEARYTEGTLDLLVKTTPKDPVFEFTWPVPGSKGDVTRTERIQAPTEAEAKEILRDMLGDRSRLPNGTTCERAV